MNDGSVLCVSNRQNHAMRRKLEGCFECTSLYLQSRECCTKHCTRTNKAAPQACQPRPGSVTRQQRMQRDNAESQERHCHILQADFHDHEFGI